MIERNYWGEEIIRRKEILSTKRQRLIADSLLLYLGFSKLECYLTRISQLMDDYVKENRRTRLIQVGQLRRV